MKLEKVGHHSEYVAPKAITTKTLAIPRVFFVLSLATIHLIWFFS
jgi:hypothetical protein